MSGGEGLSPGDINRFAIEQRARAFGDIDEHGNIIEGIEHDPIFAQAEGELAVDEALVEGPLQLFGDDDTELFRRTQLLGSVVLDD